MTIAHEASTQEYSERGGSKMAAGAATPPRPASTPQPPPPSGGQEDPHADCDNLIRTVTRLSTELSVTRTALVDAQRRLSALAEELRERDTDRCTKCGTEPRAPGYAMCARCVWGLLRPILAPVASAVDRDRLAAAAGETPPGLNHLIREIVAAHRDQRPINLHGLPAPVWLQRILLEELAGVVPDRQPDPTVVADRDRLAAAAHQLDSELLPHVGRAGMSPGHEALAQALAVTDWQPPQSD